MLIWGSGGKIKDLGCVGHTHCPTCDQQRPFHLYLEYRYRHIGYIFRWVQRKIYLNACAVCQYGASLRERETEALLGYNPIPFTTRYGWTALAALVLGVGLLMALGSHQRHLRQAGYLDAPQVNDIYLADLNQILPSTEHNHLYGVLRVVAVHGEQLQLAVSKGGYSQPGAAQKDIQQGAARNGNYYSALQISKTRSQLQSLLQEGVVESVYR